MRTADLVDSLAATTKPVRRRALSMRFGLALSAATGIALVGLILLLGVRPDLREAVSSFPFWMKTVYTASVGGVGVYLALRLVRPGARVGPAPGLMAFALTGAVGLLGLAELLRMPAERRMDVWLGSSWSTCPFWILGLSAPLLLAGLWVLRRAAPPSPGAAGLALGLAAGGISATVYGLHCVESAAAFLATWYVAGILTTAMVGGLIGRIGLRW